MGDSSYVRVTNDRQHHAGGVDAREHERADPDRWSFLCGSVLLNGPTQVVRTTISPSLGRDVGVDLGVRTVGVEALQRGDATDPLTHRSADLARVGGANAHVADRAVGRARDRSPAGHAGWRPELSRSTTTSRGSHGGTLPAKR